MNVFEDYASYYNLLYHDKDYAGEAKFIQKILLTYAPGACQIMELGCGTGKHAVLLAAQGYQMYGVDQSVEMIQQADANLVQFPSEIAHKLKFTRGDIRNFRTPQKFDAVLSLFHVVSYQVGNEDLLATFATVKEHLSPNGIFVFDVWYGPAVLNNQPAIRIKRAENEQIKIARIAEPTLYPNDNIVDVNYHFFVEDKRQNTFKQFQENHRMRYLFKSEISFLAQEFGLKVIACREWMSDRDPGFDTWSVYFVIMN
jgi:SAM-dependent methyltransferase